MCCRDTAFCETNGINIHYIGTGGNKPPLILLHRLMTNLMDNWEEDTNVGKWIGQMYLLKA